MSITIRDVREHELDSILALNNAAGSTILPLDAAGVRKFHDEAAYFRVAEAEDHLAGFLIGLRENADYGSDNFLWFREHYPQFLYIDRIVVDAHQHGRGLAVRLYDDLLEFAKASGIAQLTCEFDLDPPNPASAQFHARYGFREVGRQWLGGGKKQVSLQTREVTT